MTSQRPMLTDLVRLLDAEAPEPIALIRKEGADQVDVYAGTLGSATSVAQIPLVAKDVIAALPYHQIRERGFDAILDESQLLYLESDQHWKLPLEELLDLLPTDSVPVEDLGFTTNDQEYAETVEEIIENEIGGGAGANFVIRRDYLAKTEVPVRKAALTWLRELLRGEQGSYWTFAFITDQVALVGASPERHVSASGGKVLMNPISGTFRHGGTESSEAELVAFIKDRKESEELVMVVDEELKMMSAVCPGGGVMTGPFLKPMSRVTHTEYLLEGRSDLDVREILRLTMFAPTVTGSPMGSSCSVIAEYEPSGRGYYSGVLAHFHRTKDGYDLDAPILIRTAEISPEGDIKISAGATLVRHSSPEGEALETRVKASGVLTALGLLEAAPRAGGHQQRLADSPEVQRVLAERNQHLAPFWRDAQALEQTAVPVEKTAIVVDCGDDFSGMLAHQLRHLGFTVAVQPWDWPLRADQADLVIFGPGPGDPTDDSDPKVQRVRELVNARIETGKPLLATAFSHQVLAQMAGLDIKKLASPRQGEAIEVDVFGEPSLIGFYNTSAAQGANGEKTPQLNLEIQAEPETGIVNALVGPRVASIQGHPESVLSLDGLETLKRVTDALLGGLPR